MQTTKCATNRFKWTNPKHGVLVYRENIGKLLNSVTDIHKLLRSLLQGGGSGGVGGVGDLATSIPYCSSCVEPLSDEVS